MTEILDDIRKIYLFEEVCEPLLPYVEFFSESSADLTRLEIGPADFTVEMFPSWTPTVWINLGVPYAIETASGSSVIGKNRDVLVLRGTTVTRNNTAGDHIFTIKFMPGGLEAVMGVKQSMIKNTFLDAADIFPQSFLLSLRQAGSFSERKTLAENFLLARLHKRGGQPDHYLKIVRGSIGLYCESGMRYNTTQVAEKMFVSSKTINRYFTSVVGVTPKKYFASIRARAALKRYRDTSGAFDPSFFGYYDMGHFYREAIAFTGRRISRR